ncbi:MAG: SPFH domain-containing protein [Planctomycetota bacterium]
MKYIPLQILGGALLAVAGLVGYTLWKSDSWGLVDIPPSHVAVKIDYPSGQLRVVEGPGYCVYVPFFQEVRLLDRRPQAFRMEGEADQGANHVKYLTVRARDGSNFWFDSMEILYQILPSQGAAILTDSGGGDAFRDWMCTYARSVLRDEFGRYNAQDVANLTESQSAKVEGRRRLNEYLAAHGVEVVQVTTPKPKFDRNYEKAIYERKIANQEVEKLGAQIEQLREQRGQRLAKLRKENDLALEDLRGTLEQDRLQAEQQEIQLRGQADVYALTRGQEGETRRAELLAEAAGLRERNGREAEALAATIAAIEAGGELAVRAALVQQLGDVHFRVMTQGDERLARTASDASATSGKGL